jgi:beta-lactamase regulating signal transducer with metallopeptidase domain
MEKTEVLYPWILAMWGAGVVLFSLRILASWIGTRLLVRRRLPVPAALAETFSRLARQLALRRVPEIFASAKVADAAVIGFLKPIVLLPAAWLTELSPDVLEAVLAHELAHIRRYDLWVNLLQRAIESVLFYHPAVWWVSRRVRAEREMCCDELAISVTHQRLAYVTALESVARHRAGLVKPALALTLGDQDMALLKRIRHLLGMSPASAGGGSWPAIVLALALPAGLWLAWDTTAPGATAAADETAILGDGPHESPPPPKNPDEDRRDRDRTDDEDRPPRPRRFEGAGLRDDDRRGPPPRDEGPRRGPPEGDEDGPPRRRPDELNDTYARPRPGGVGRFREPLGGRNRRPEEDEFRRPGPDGAPQEELVRLLMELRHEVAELRNEVRELRGERGRGSEFDRDGERQYRLNPPPAKRKIGDDDDARPPVLPDNRMRRGRLDDEDADDGRDLMRRRGAPSLRRPGRPPENRPGATRDPRELAPYRVPMPVDEGAPSRREAPPDPTVKAPPTGPAST